MKTRKSLKPYKGCTVVVTTVKTYTAYGKDGSPIRIIDAPDLAELKRRVNEETKERATTC